MSHKLIGLLLFLSGFIAGWAWMNYRQALEAPIIKNTPVVIEIIKGDSVNRIVEKLNEQNLNVNPLWFRLIAFQNGSTAKLKAGEYEFRPTMTLTEVIEMIAQGKTRQHSIRFLEGWSFAKMLTELRQNPNIRQTLPEKNEESLLAEIGAPQNKPEGLFFPDTYYFEKHTPDIALLKRAFTKMQAVLNEEWQNRSSDLPIKTPYEALILASIIEKETAVDHERALIGGVMIRRLKKGIPLQTDPTVIYGMGENFHGNLAKQDLTHPSPFNTYLIHGLPPTPIAMPGRKAIHAALHPEQGKSLYFVAKGDGTHVFSSTLKEHNKAVKLFQKQKNELSR